MKKKKKTEDREEWYKELNEEYKEIIKNKDIEEIKNLVKIVVKEEEIIIEEIWLEEEFL